MLTGLKNWKSLFFFFSLQTHTFIHISYICWMDLYRHQTHKHTHLGLITPKTTFLVTPADLMELITFSAVYKVPQVPPVVTVSGLGTSENREALFLPHAL